MPLLTCTDNGISGEAENSQNNPGWKGPWVWSNLWWEREPRWYDPAPCSFRSWKSSERDSATFLAKLAVFNCSHCKKKKNCFFHWDEISPSATCTQLHLVFSTWLFVRRAHPSLFSHPLKYWNNMKFFMSLSFSEKVRMRPNSFHILDTNGFILFSVTL